MDLYSVYSELMLSEHTRQNWTKCIVGCVDTELKLSGQINTVDTECQGTQKAEQRWKAQCTDGTVNTGCSGETVDTDIKVDTEG